jgi:hypothetical protein
MNKSVATPINEATHSGGCQCGRVRYRITGELGDGGICHCRMCQKASGNIALPLVSAAIERFEWTRGKPSEFRSSSIVARGFCNHCGTPLYMLEDGFEYYEITVGSLDNSEAAAPTHAVGLESKLTWFDSLAKLPGHSTSEDRSPEDLAKLTSHQHPDHDTDEWPG